jgi:hypothetical protein
MPRPKILSTISQPDGWTLVLYQHQGVYRVGILSLHGRPRALAASRYERYEEAYARLLLEAQSRRQGHL